MEGEDPVHQGRKIYARGRTPAMESRAKLAGHAIHPMLIVFPLGLLGISLVFDIAYFLTSDASFAAAAFWDITAGIIGGLLAALFGLVDWLAIPNGTRAK